MIAITRIFRPNLLGALGLLAGVAILASSPAYAQGDLVLPVVIDTDGQVSSEPTVIPEAVPLPPAEADGLEALPTVEGAGDGGLADLEDLDALGGGDGELHPDGMVEVTPIGGEVASDAAADDLVLPIGATEGVLPMEESDPGEMMAEGRRDDGVFRFTLGASVVYDDNIFISAREEVSDVLYVISPGISINLGDATVREHSYLYLNYNPEAVFFHETDEENAFDQNLELGGGWRGARLSADATAGYQSLSGSTVDAGDRTDRRVFYGNLVLSYGWGERTRLETGFYYEQTDYDDLIDTLEYRNETFLEYQWTPKTSLGLGVAVGRLEVSESSGDQNFQQVLVRGRSQLGAKVAVHGRVGADFRQAEAGDDVRPVFGFGAEYEPRDGTLLTLDASREITASAAEEGEVYVRTAAELGVRQRFMRRWNIGIDGGVERLDYEAVADAGDGAREEEGYYVRPSVRYDFKEGLKGELYYLLRDNDSNLPDESYRANQIGVSVGIDF